MGIELWLSELQTAHLVHPEIGPDPTYLFSHVLMQETAYRSLLFKGRRELHRLIAATYEHEYADRLDEYVPTLVHHYWWGEDWLRAAQFAHRAAQRSVRVYALREAIGYLSQSLQALDRLPDPPAEETCDVICEWTQAAFGFEPFPILLERLERAERLARQLGDKRRLAMALLLQGRIHVASGHGSRAEAPLTECYALVTELGDDELAVFPTFAMGMVAGDADPLRARSLFERAAELAHRFGNVDVESNALSMKAVMEAFLGEVAACRQSIKQALGIVGQGTSPVSDADVYLGAAWACLELGEAPEAVDYARLSVDKAVATDNMECACFGFAILGLSHLSLEHLAEAVRAFEEAIRRSKISGAEEAQILGESGVAMVRYLDGHPEALQELEKTLGRAKTINKDYAAARIAQTLGDYYMQRGDAANALAHLTDAFEYYQSHHMRLHAARTLESLAHYYEWQGEGEKAKELGNERAELLAGPPGPAKPHA